MTSVREGSVPATQPSLTLAGTADAQVCQVGCEVAGAAGAAQRGEGGLLGVQRGREGGGEVDVGQVRQGAPRVVGGRDRSGRYAYLLFQFSAPLPSEHMEL